MLIGYKRLGHKAPLWAALLLLLAGIGIGWTDEPMLDTDAPANTQAQPAEPSLDMEAPSTDTVQLPPPPDTVVPTSRLDGRKVIPGLPPKPEDEAKAAETQPATNKHPVVQAVIPLVPDTPFPEDWLQPPAPADVPDKPLQPLLPKTVAAPVTKNNAAKPLKNPAIIEEKVELKPAKGTLVNPAPQASTSSKQKPLVHFPAGAFPPPSKTATAPAVNKANSITPSRTNAYPKGYKPYVAPVVPQQRQWNAQAIAAYNRGNRYGRQNKLELAITEYKQALDLAPTLADAYVGLSTAHIHQNDWENGMAEARQALGLKTGFLDPSNIIQAKVNLALSYCVVDDYRTARKYLQQLQKSNYAALPQLEQFLDKQCKP